MPRTRTPQHPSPGAANGLLALAWLAGNAADLLTTWTGLALGLREANPLMARLPFGGMVLVKTAAALAVTLALRDRAHLLRTAGVGQWSVVGWNTVLVLRRLATRRA